MVVAAGLEKADIDIVGGDSIFFDRLVGSITHGQERRRLRRALDRRAGPRRAATWTARPTSPSDLGRVLGSVNTGDVANLTLSAFLAQQIKAGGAGRRQAA